MDLLVLLKPAATLFSLALYFVVRSMVNSAIAKFRTKQKFSEKRTAYIKKFFTLSLFSILLVAVAFVWGIDIRGVLIFASSFFAVVGIALFASWSVLSNITSGIIIFFSFPYKIGDTITIVDGDNSVRGEVMDMTLFCIQIKDESGNLTSYPNSLAIQKPITKLR